jgi:hypothetical protein
VHCPEIGCGAIFTIEHLRVLERGRDDIETITYALARSAALAW